MCKLLIHMVSGYRLSVATRHQNVTFCAKWQARPTRAGSGLSVPLHPSSGDLQLTAHRIRRFWRHVPLEGLPRTWAHPPQIHDPAHRRVHAPLPAARAALGLSSHPPLRLARQRQPPARHRHRSRTAAWAAAHAFCGSRRWLRRTRPCGTHLRVPALWRADARHRDLRAGSAHPWTAGFIPLAMIDSASTYRLSQTAFSSSMPSRTPVASFCKAARCCHHRRLLDVRLRCVLGLPPIHMHHAVPTIFAFRSATDVQIPIAPRLC